MANVAAVIGLAGRFPGEPTIENFWSYVQGGAAASEVADDCIASSDTLPGILQR